MTLIEGVSKTVLKVIFKLIIHINQKDEPYSDE